MKNTEINRRKSKQISYNEFMRIAEKFRRCPVSQFQASNEAYYTVEWTDGNNFPDRLVENFKAIFG
jgi:hypothetical protein